MIVTERIAVILVFLLNVSNVNSTPTIYTCTKLSIGSIRMPYALMKANQTQEFRTEFRSLNCSNTQILETSDASDPAFLFYETGDIVVPDKHYFLPEDYCISVFTNDSVEIKHCEVTCGKTHTCFHKCCPPHQVVDVIALSDSSGSFCSTTKDGVTWSPVFYDAAEGCGIRVTDHIPYHYIPTSYDEVKGVIQTPYKHIVTSASGKIPGSRFRILRNGHIMGQASKNEWKIIEPNHSCIDGMREADMMYSGNIHEQVILDLVYDDFGDDFNDTESENNSSFSKNETNNSSFSENEPTIELGVDYFYITLMLIGAAFLLAISTIYLLIWEKHNIHGWTIFAYVTTMFFMFVFLSSARILSITKDSDFGGTRVCKNIGICTHFFYLSTMCWLTIINVDLWLTFRNVKPTTNRRENVTRFIFYTLFAKGCPALIVLFAVILDEVYHDGIGDGSECVPAFILPVYGEDHCYIQEGAYWPWLYWPIAILLCCNILTFSSTVFSLVMYRRTTRNAVGSTTHQKESVILFAKLFIVAGISWVFELLSTSTEEPWWIWIIFDSYNLLQAILIFIIFALKRENIVFLYQKYPFARGLLRPILHCCYSSTFDPERTEVTGASFDRTSKFHFRKGSTASTCAMLSSGRSSIVSANSVRRDSGPGVEFVS